LPLDRGDFVEPLAMVRETVEAGLEPRLDNIQGERFSDDPRPQAKHVYVVMFAALVGRIGVMAKPGADSRELIGRNRAADAAAAQHDAHIGPAVEYGFGHLARQIRVVHRIVIMRPDIQMRMAEGFQLRHDRRFQLVSGMIGSDDDSHLHCSRRNSAPCGWQDDSILTQKDGGSRDDVRGGEAEFFHQHRARSGGTEIIDAEHIALVAHILSPALRRASLNR